MAKASAASTDIQVECQETSPVIRSLRVEVAASRVTKAFDRAYRELSRTARVKGFRPGKVPRSVLERLYGPSMPDEIEKALVSETLPEAIEQAEIQPVSEPDVDAERPESGSAFCYSVRVEVKPVIELPDLSVLIGQKPIVDVAESEIDAELERLREQHAPIVEEAEGVVIADAHRVTIDFAGRVDGESFPGGTGKGMEIEIGSGGMVPGFEEQLIGARSGDDVQVSVTFPEDYGVEALNGKDAVFDCHVVAVRRREVPELDDEFAKDIGEFETLSELRDSIRAGQTKKRESESSRALEASLMTALLEACEFDVPPGVVERQLQGQMRSMHQQFHGQVPDDVLNEQLGRMRESGRPLAERRVREALVLEAIGEAQEVTVSEDEIEARLAEMAEAQGMDADRLRSMAKAQGWLGAIEAELRDRKIYEYLASQANVLEAPAETEAESDATAEV